MFTSTEKRQIRRFHVPNDDDDDDYEDDNGDGE